MLWVEKKKTPAFKFQGAYILIEGVAHKHRIPSGENANEKGTGGGGKRTRWGRGLSIILLASLKW